MEDSDNAFTLTHLADHLRYDFSGGRLVSESDLDSDVTMCQICAFSRLAT